jgi:hypothetical protein
MTPQVDDVLVNRRRRRSDMPSSPPGKQPIVVVEQEEGWFRHELKLRRKRYQLVGTGALEHPGIARELEHVDEQLAQHDVDPLLSEICRRLNVPWKPPEAGVHRSQLGAAPAKELSAEELQVAVVYDLLVRRGATDPDAPGFDAAFHAANERYDRHSPYYATVARVLVEAAGDRRLSIGLADEAVDRLAAAGAPTDDEEAARAAVAAQTASGDACGPSTMAPPELSLAGLAGDQPAKVTAEDLVPAAVVWYFARLQDTGMFSFVDGLLTAADEGRLRISPSAEELLERYRAQSQFTWLSPQRRQALIGRLLGPPFPALLRAFVSEGHDLVNRMRRIDLSGSNIPPRVYGEGLREAAFGLALEIQSKSFGTTSRSAALLQDQIQLARLIAQDDSVQRAYCSFDWLSLLLRARGRGDLSDIIRELSLARAGAVVIAGLASKADVLSGEEDDPLFDFAIAQSDVRGEDVFAKPSDADVLAAIEQLYHLLHVEPEARAATADTNGDGAGTPAAPAPAGPLPLRLQFQPDAVLAQPTALGQRV